MLKTFMAKLVVLVYSLLKMTQLISEGVVDELANNLIRRNNPGLPSWAPLFLEG